MGSELVGLFILSKLKDTFGNNIDLYRDDGLVLLDTKCGRLSDKASKDLTHAFNELGLNNCSSQPTQHQLPGHNLRLIKRYVQTIQKSERRTPLHKPTFQPSTSDNSRTPHLS